jgi:circadian clock protein KaiC
VAPLDAMLGGRGFYKGSTILLSGTAGAGKTSLAASFANAACARGERSLYFLLEESPRQIMRNMRSIGLDLGRWVDRGLLRMHADRPSRFGLEAHLAAMYRAIEEFEPQVVVVDSITDLLSLGNQTDVRAMLVRLIDHLKTRAVTALFSSLTSATAELPDSHAGVSSLMDAWVLLSLEQMGETRRRHLSVLKSRGMAHSNRVYEFTLTEHGFEVAPAGSTGARPGGN